MLPTIVLVLSFHLSLHLMCGCGAAADEVVYDRPSGLPLVLSCRSDPAKGNGTKLNWVYNGLPVPFRMSSNCSTKYCVRSDSLYDLIIQNVSLANSGLYTCSIAYSDIDLPESIRAVTLTVRDVPGLPTIVPAALDMIEGQAFMLTCQSLGGYPAPNITWYKAGLQLQSNVSLSPSSNGNVNGTISIVPSYADDGTSITCVAQNVLGSRNSTAHLNVSYGPRDVVLTSSPASVVEGGDVMLACSAKGKPLPTMSWSMPNTSGSGVQRNDSGAGTSYLYVSHIQRQGAGPYICTASNLVNKTFNLSSSSNITVDVLYAPGKPNVYPNSAKLSSGDNVTLTCNVTDPGNPAARYNWTKDGQTIDVGSSAGTLMLPLVRLSSTGLYVCTVYNSAGAAASDICNISVFAKPVVVPGLGPTVGYVGKPITLACSAVGNPLPIITWVKNSSTNSSWNVTTVLNGSMIFTVDSKLLIARLTQEDYGAYTCFANSSFGNDSSSVVIVAPSPPLPPSSVQVVAARWSTIVMSWNASFDGGYEQDFSVYMNATQACSTTNTSCTATVSPPGSYVVYVVANNYVGKSNSSEFIVANLVEGPSASGLSFGRPWNLPYQADAEYCVEVKCSYTDPQSSISLDNCTQLGAVTAKNIPCAATQARYCLTNFLDVVCGPFANLTGPPVFDASSTPLPRETVIIIVCVVIGSVLLIGIVITAVCCARCRGHKSSPPASLIHNSHDLSLSSAVRLSASSETPYATYVRDQVYANPNFPGEGEDDLSQDGVQTNDPNLAGGNPQRRDYIYASVGVRRQPARVSTHNANGVSGYDMHDFDEIDGSHRDDSSSVSEPPPYHPQTSVAESDATSTTESKQAKRVLYEVIV